MEGFPLNLNGTFTSTRGCAEPMLPMCQVKVKVTVKGQIFNKQYYTLCRVRSITPLLMEGFSSNLNDTFTSTTGCAEPMFFPQHILPLLPLYNAQWWGYESLTAIVLVISHTFVIVLPHGMEVCVIDLIPVLILNLFSTVQSKVFAYWSNCHAVFVLLIKGLLVIAHE